MRAVTVFSILLPIAELNIGGCLSFRSTALLGAWGAAALYILFGVAMSINLLRGQHELPCGCIGQGKQKISWRLVLLDLTLASLALSLTVA